MEPCPIKIAGKQAMKDIARMKAEAKVSGSTQIIKLPIIIKGDYKSIELPAAAEFRNIEWLVSLLEEQNDISISGAMCPLSGNLTFNTSEAIGSCIILFPLVFRGGPTNDVISLHIPSAGNVRLMLKISAKALTIDLKQAIANTHKIPIDRQILYDGTIMLKDSLSLEAQGVKNKDRINIDQFVKRRLAGPVVFLDAEKEELKEDAKLSPIAPKYRVLDKGLNIEGKCPNPECSVYQKKVIMQAGLGYFDLNLHLKKCICPLCKRKVKPITCFFRECYYRFVGEQTTSSGESKKVVRNWEDARVPEGYTRYNPNEKKDMLEWDRLVIFTSESNCNYCQFCGELGGNATEFGNIYHQECKKKAIEKS